MARRPKTSRNTVNVDMVRSDAQKLATEFAELAPGSVQRQSPLEQDMGTAKYREMIHDHNSKNEHILDKLPFTFPKKRIVRTKEDRMFACPKCKTRCLGGATTFCIICSKCGEFFKVNKGEFKPKVGMFNRASDVILKEK